MKQSKVIDLFIRLPDGQHRLCQFPVDQTLAAVLTSLEMTGCLIQSQGKPLKDSLTLQQVDIQTSGCINLSMPLPGGSRPGGSRKPSPLKAKVIAPILVNANRGRGYGVTPPKAEELKIPRERTQNNSRETIRSSNKQQEPSTQIHSLQDQDDQEDVLSLDSDQLNTLRQNLRQNEEMSEALLNRSQFYKQLPAAIQQNILQVLQQDLDKFGKFNLAKGYAVMEDDDSFIEALNQLYSDERRKLYNAIKNHGHSNFFSRYLRMALSLSDSGSTSLVTSLSRNQDSEGIQPFTKTKSEMRQSLQFKRDNRSSLLNFDETEKKGIDSMSYLRAQTYFTQSNTVAERMAEYTSKDSPEHLKKWYRQHHFDLSKDFDQDLIETLRSNQELHAFIPALPQGMRILPIIKQLSFERKLDLLLAVSNDEAAANTLNSLLCKSSSDDVELDKFETLAELWKIVDSTERNSLVEKMRQGTDLAELIKSALSSPVLKVIRGDELEKKEAEKQIQRLWNSLQPNDRQKLAFLFLKEYKAPKSTSSRSGSPAKVLSADNSTQEKFGITSCNLLRIIFDVVDLDSRVELISLVGEDKLQSIIESQQTTESFWFPAKSDAYRNKELQEEAKAAENLTVAQTELLLHRFFHLREIHDRERTEALLGEVKGKSFSNFKNELDKVNEDLEQSWQYVPVDVPGDYMQCLPAMDENRTFLLVQPVCFNKHSTQDHQLGSVSNSIRNDQRAQNCPITSAEGQDEKILGETFSVISFWRYECKQFVCKHAFTTPKLVPIKHASKDPFADSYVLRGRDNKLYCFCEGKTDQSQKSQEDLEVDQSKSPLLLCTITSMKKNGDFDDEVRSSNFSTNVITQQISSESMLYMYVKQDSIEEIKKFKILRKRFHETPLTFFSAGPEYGTMCTFSLLRAGDIVPSMYVYSLNAQKEILIAEGVEGFIDYVPIGNRDHEGYLYFIMQSYLRTAQFGYQAICTVSDYKNQIKLHTQQPETGEKNLLNVLKVPINFANPPVCSEDPENEPGSLVKIMKAGGLDDQQKYEINCIQDTKRFKFDNYVAGSIAKENLFCQSKCWITQLVPAEIDKEYGQIKSFVVQTMGHINRDYKLYLLDMSEYDEDEYIERGECSEQQLSISYRLVTPSIKACYVTPCPDQRPMIQTVLFLEDEFIFDLYVDGRLETGEITQSQDRQSARGGFSNRSSLSQQAKRPYKHLKTKRMLKEIHAVPQEVILSKDNLKLYGCFLDSHSKSVNWLHEDLRKEKLGDSFQKEFVQANYQVEYPVLCYSGVRPDVQELNIVTLVDKAAPVTTLALENLQLHSFVEYPDCYDQVKICFLALDYSIDQKDNSQDGEVVLCQLGMDKMFEKKLANDFSYLTFKKEDLGGRSNKPDFLKQMSIAVKIEAVHDLEKSRGELFFVMQTQSSLWTYYNDGRNMNDFRMISKNRLMRKICFQRGCQNDPLQQSYFFVERSSKGAISDVIRELRVNKKNYEAKIQTIYSLHSRFVIALEYDPVSRAMDATGDKENDLFFIDDGFTLHKLNQNEEGIFVPKVICDLAKTFPFNQLDRLYELRRSEFQTVSITDLAVTIDEISVNLGSNNSWKFKYGNEVEDWTVLSTESNVNCFRQVLSVQHQRQNSETVEEAFIIKPHSSGRTLDLVGFKAQRNIKLVEFIASELLLLKINSYWTIMDTTGQIRVIEKTLQNVLYKHDFSSMSSRLLPMTNQVLLMLYHKTYIVTVLFNHRGQPCEINEYPTDMLKTRSFGNTKNENFSELHCDEKGNAFKITTVWNDEIQASEDNDSSIDIHYKQKKSQNNSNRVLTCVKIMLHGPQTIIKYVICGDYLCWIKPLVSGQIHFEKLSTFHAPTTSSQSVKSIRQRTKQGLAKIQPKVINLESYLPESKAKGFAISVAPFSTLLSMRTQNIVDYTQEQQINRNLLQLTIGDRACVIDIAQQKYVLDFCDMDLFIEPEQYVPAHVNIQDCTIQTNDQQKMLTNSYVGVNKARTFFITKRRTTKMQSLDDEFDLKYLTEEVNSNEVQVSEVLVGSYKTYNECDYHELLTMYECLIEDKPTRRLDLECILSLYCGIPIFAMQADANIYQAIEKSLEETDLRPKSDDQENDIECHQLKRLHRILNMPLPYLSIKPRVISEIKDKDEMLKELKMCSGMFSVMNMVPYSTDQGSSNRLLSIAVKCNQTSLKDVCKMQRDFERLLQNTSESVYEILMNSDEDTKSTSVIKQVKWPVGQTFCAFTTPHCLVTHDEIEDKILISYARSKSIWSMLPCRDEYILKRSQKYEQDLQTHIVRVRQIDLEWLFTNKKNFLEVSIVLTDAGRPDLLLTDYVQVMLEVYWTEFKWKIFWRIFAPYVLYTGITLYYFFNILLVHETNTEIETRLLATMNMMILIYQLYVEFMQAYNSKKQFDLGEYLSDILNLLDLFQYLVVAFMLTLTLFNVNWPTLETKRIVCTFMVFVVWFKMFDWMRLFDATSFYIKLIVKTVQDIGPFMLIHLIFLLSFGCALECISMNREEDQAVVGEYTGWWFLDIVIDQHLLAMGSFNTLKFPGENQGLIWLIFSVASFFTLITALNMLIAIMGNTFDQVTASYEQHSRQMKLALLSDYVTHIRPKKHRPRDSFAYIVTTEGDSNDDTDKFEDNVNQIRDIIEGQVTRLQTNFKERTDYLSELIADQQKTAATQEKQFTRQINMLSEQIKDSMAHLESRIEEIAEFR